jgi:hypothetical protein
MRMWAVERKLKESSWRRYLRSAKSRRMTEVDAVGEDRGLALV